MAIYDIKVKNIDGVERSIKQQAVKGLEECGLLAEGYAKDLCPVDTGNLRNSITHSVVIEEGACYVGRDIEYAPYVEFGTGVHLCIRQI